MCTTLCFTSPESCGQAAGLQGCTAAAGALSCCAGTSSAHTELTAQQGSDSQASLSPTCARRPVLGGAGEGGDLVPADGRPVVLHHAPRAQAVWLPRPAQHSLLKPEHSAMQTAAAQGRQPGRLPPALCAKRTARASAMLAYAAPQSASRGPVAGQQRQSPHMLRTPLMLPLLNQRNGGHASGQAEQRTSRTSC